MGKYPSNKINYKHTDETWSSDSAHMIDYKTLNKKRFRYIFIILGKLNNYIWAIPLQNIKIQKQMNSQTF